MPEPNIGDRSSYGACVHEFKTAKLRRGSRTLAHDQVRRGWSKIITIFQWILIFEQSVDRRRGPRWWPQIGAAETRLGVVSRIELRVSVSANRTESVGRLSLSLRYGKPLTGNTNRPLRAALPNRYE